MSEIWNKKIWNDQTERDLLKDNNLQKNTNDKTKEELWNNLIKNISSLEKQSDKETINLTKEIIKLIIQNAELKKNAELKNGGKLNSELNSELKKMKKKPCNIQ